MKIIIKSLAVLSLITLCTPHLEAKKAKAKVSMVSDEKKDQEIFAWLRTTSEVCSALRQRPFRNINFNDCFQEGLKAMVNAAGAHDAFFTPDSYKSAIDSASGQFSGIGVSTISKTAQDDGLIIVDVLNGYPAEKAGLQAKDKIVEVDGCKLKGLSSDEVIDKIKGKRKTKVKLKIVRDDKKPMEFLVMRDTIKNESSLGYYFPAQNVSYLALKLFAENSAEQMSKFIKKANEKKSKGLIVDLRRNPGGVLEAAVDIAGLFLDKGSPVVITKNKERKVQKTYKTQSNPIFHSAIPLFLLIDNFSASASEIFAGCMKYYSEKLSESESKIPNPLMVFLVGTQTFGKGSVQEVFPIGNGCAMKLTTMLYYLPNDVSIQAQGITPDFTIKPKMIPEKELKWINELYGKETSLKGHITREEVENKASMQMVQDEPKTEDAGLNDEEDGENKKFDEKTWKEKQRKALTQDVQVQAAINMIQLLSLAKKTQPEMVSNRTKAIAFLKNHYLTDDDIEIEEVKE